MTYRAALVLGGVLLVASPAIYLMLRLDSLVPAVLLAVSRNTAHDHGRSGRDPPGRAALAGTGRWSTSRWAYHGW